MQAKLFLGDQIMLDSSRNDYFLESVNKIWHSTVGCITNNGPEKESVKSMQIRDTFVVPGIRALYLVRFTTVQTI